MAILYRHGGSSVVSTGLDTPADRAGLERYETKNANQLLGIQAVNLANSIQPRTSRFLVVGAGTDWQGVHGSRGAIRLPLIRVG